MSGEAGPAEAARIGHEARKRTRALTDGEIAVLREGPPATPRESDARNAADAAEALRTPWRERGEARNEAREALGSARERRPGAEIDLGLAARKACGKREGGAE